MKVLLFTHKNDIDGMGNAVLANVAFDAVDYELCGTFDLTSKVLEYYNANILPYISLLRTIIFIHQFCQIQVV